jgi:hypothetical protein
MRYFKYFIAVFFTGIGLSACHNHPEVQSFTISVQDSIQHAGQIKRALTAIDSAAALLQPGDLVLRTGNDFTSESLRSLNRRDQTYSHCGIANIENGQVVVYHALGGDFNPDQKIRRDPLAYFADPETNRGIGIYHFNLDEKDTRCVLKTAGMLYQMGIPFDMGFDLQSNDRMYCAEFVYKTFRLGTKEKLKFNTSHIGDFRFVGVDDLFLQPDCSLKKRISFN